MELELKVKQTLAKVPLEGVQEVVVCCLMDNGAVNVVKTDTLSQDDAASITWVAYSMYSE